MWGGYKNQTKVIGYKVNLILRFGIFFFLIPLISSFFMTGGAWTYTKFYSVR